MRGAAVYPIAFYQDKLMFLLGEEDSYCSSYTEYSKIAAFGGRAHTDETIENCAAREAFEELNGLYYTPDEWLDQFNSSNLYKVIVFDQSKAFFVVVPYDEMISKHFNGTRQLLKTLREKTGVSHKDMMKHGFAEKLNIRWYTEDDIARLLTTTQLRDITKKTLTQFLKAQ